MFYPFLYRRHLISGVIPLQKGKCFIDYYYQGKVFLYFNVLFNLIRAHFPAGEKI